MKFRGLMKKMAENMDMCRMCMCFVMLFSVAVPRSR